MQSSAAFLPSQKLMQQPSSMDHTQPTSLHSQFTLGSAGATAHHMTVPGVPTASSSASSSTMAALFHPPPSQSSVHPPSQPPPPSHSQSHHPPSASHQSSFLPSPQTPMQTDHYEQPSTMDSLAGAASTSHDITMTAREEDKRKEIYGYDAPFTLFSSTWSAATDPQRRFRLAVSSFIEEYSNKISIVQLDEEAGELVLRSTFDHPYPATKLMWIPDSKGTHPDLIATSGDYLRLWRLGADNQAKIETLLNTNRTAEYCAPLTSFDWNELDLSLIATSSIDTTCTVWQLETGQPVGTIRGSDTVDGAVRTQLIAHDKEVFDISWSRGSKDVFASVGADGSVRLFDLRHLEHSTIVYEDPKRTPLLRLAWNRNDHNYLATFACDSNEVLIIDMRIPCTPVAVLANHKAAVNGVSWAPHSSSHLCTAADDSQALIWDVHQLPQAIEDPILAYQAGGEVNQIHWSTTFPDWISICYGNRLEILRV